MPESFDQLVDEQGQAELQTLRDQMESESHYAAMMSRVEAMENEMPEPNRPSRVEPEPIDSESVATQTDWPHTADCSVQVAFDRPTREAQMISSSVQADLLRDTEGWFRRMRSG